MIFKYDFLRMVICTMFLKITSLVEYIKYQYTVSNNIRAEYSTVQSIMDMCRCCLVERSYEMILIRNAKGNLKGSKHPEEIINVLCQYFVNCFIAVFILFIIFSIFSFMLSIFVDNMLYICFNIEYSNILKIPIKQLFVMIITSATYGLNIFAYSILSMLDMPNVRLIIATISHIVSSVIINYGHGIAPILVYTPTIFGTLVTLLIVYFLIRIKYNICLLSNVLRTKQIYVFDLWTIIYMGGLNIMISLPTTLHANIISAITNNVISKDNYRAMFKTIHSIVGIFFIPFMSQMKSSFSRMPALEAYKYSLYTIIKIVPIILFIAIFNIQIMKFLSTCFGHKNVIYLLGMDRMIFFLFSVLIQIILLYNVLCSNYLSFTYHMFLYNTISIMRVIFNIIMPFVVTFIIKLIFGEYTYSFILHGANIFSLLSEFIYLLVNVVYNYVFINVDNVNI